MWDHLWFNATLVTCNADCNDYGLLSSAALAIKEDKIVWLGTMDQLPSSANSLAKNITDAQNQIITPGLIDCHTHLVYAGNRMKDFSLRLHGESYEAIAKQGGGIVSTVNATRKANVDELYTQSAKRLQAMLQQGVTTVEIKSGYGLDAENEFKQLQVIKRLAENFPLTLYPTFLGAHALPTDFKNRADEYIDYVCRETLPKIAKQKLAKAVDAFCETIAFTPAQVERFFQAATQYDLAIKLHSEQLSNSSSASLAARYHALSADHLEHASEECLAAMAKANTVAVILPGAYYFLRETKKPPIDLMRQLNISMAIATDCNPGTSPTTSLTLMMNMACVFWQLTPEEALRGTTINAAKALGMAETHGSIEVGKQADFVIWDMQHPDELSYSIAGQWQKTVVKNGEVIL